MTRQKKFYIEPRKPSGIYYYVVRDPVSRKTVAYKSTGTTDKKQAETIGMEWWTNGIVGYNQTAIDRKTLFCDYLYKFWDFETSMYFRELETMGREPHMEHALEMQKAVERYYRSYFKSTLLCQIDGETLQQFIVYLKIEKHLAASTVNSARNVAFVALRYAKRKKMISHFDFDAVLRAGGKPNERGILEKDEVDKLFNLEWTSIRSRIAVLIAFFTGMRMGEIRALKVCDIHENKITVNHSWSRKNNLKCTKNRETREIPILPWLHNEIMSYIRKKNFFKLDSLLLPGKKPEIPLDSVQIREDFYKMLEKIGIDDKSRRERGIVFHSFRHLLAKNIVEKGANKAIGMKILGHKTSRIFDHYASHVDKETFDQMAKVIEIVGQNEMPKEPIPFKGAV
jgi:integrase